MPKESKEARKERQNLEEWRFADCLQRAGNQVEPEVKVANLAHPSYPFRVDYVLNDEIAIEIQGIGFGHHSFGNIQKTYRKNNAIAARGWLLIQVTREQIGNGDALEALAQCGVSVQPKLQEA